MNVLRLFCLLVTLCRIGHFSPSYYLLGSLIEDVLPTNSEEDSSGENTTDIQDKVKEDGGWLSHYCDYLYDVLGISWFQETIGKLLDTLCNFVIEPETQIERPPITYNDTVPMTEVVYTDIHETTVNSGPSTVEIPAKPPTSSVTKPLFATSLLIPSVLPPGFLPTNETTEDSLITVLASDLVNDTNYKRKKK